MFGAAFKEVSALLNKRFTLNALFPATILGIATLAIWEATGEGIAQGVDRLSGLDGTTKAVLAVFAVAIVFVIATLLSSQSTTLLAWAEGLAGPFAWRPFAAAGQSWWQSQEKGPDTTEPDFGVPREGPVAPTALGTLGYANAEYIRRAYGFDVAVAWPRLAPLLPAEFTTLLDDAETAIEQALSFSATAVLLGFVGAGIAAFHRTAVLTALSMPLAGAVLGVVLYRAALPAAAHWSQLIRAAFDLHRSELFDSLQVPRPKTTSEERDVGTRLTAILLGQDVDRSVGLIGKKA